MAFTLYHPLFISENYFINFVDVYMYIKNTFCMFVNKFKDFQLKSVAYFL
jgi:hypothetical protein